MARNEAATRLNKDNSDGGGDGDGDDSHDSAGFPRSEHLRLPCSD